MKREAITGAKYRPPGPNVISSFFDVEFARMKYIAEKPIQLVVHEAYRPTAGNLYRVILRPKYSIGISLILFRN